MALLLGTVISIPVIYLYRTLMVTFPNKNFLQMLTSVFGPIAGKILGFLFMVFILNSAAINLKDLANFTKMMVLEYTPLWALTLMCVVFSAWMVRSGLKALARYVPLLAITQFIIIIITISLLSNQIDPQNLLPMFQQPLIKYVQSTHIVSSILVGELAIFLMMTPCLEISPSDASKYWFGGIVIGIISVMLTLLRDISVLGNIAPIFTLPGLMTLRLVNLGEFLSRVEVMFATMLIILLFYKITFILYASTISYAQLFNAKAFKKLPLVMGVFLVAYCFTLYPNIVEQRLAAQTVAPFLWSFFEVVLPLCVLIGAKIRGFTPASAAAKS